MKLEKKKELAARTLNVGKGRIIFNVQRLQEIKQAITKQDIRDLALEGAILISPIVGRKKVEYRKRRRFGSIKKKVNKYKRRYILLTRKLRRYAAELKRKELISREKYLKIRKEIRAGIFKSEKNLKEHLRGKKQ